MGAPSTLRVGTAQRNINPPLGANLAGYMHRRTAKTIKSDLYTKAVVLEHGDRRLVLIANDLVCTHAEFSDPVKRMIAETYGIPPEAVMISATHTHTGPCVVQYSKAYEAVPGYLEFLIDAMMAAVREAYEGLFDASLYHGMAEAPGYAANKLLRLKDGRDFYPPCRPPDFNDADIVGPAGPLDNSVNVLCVRDGERRVRAVLVNYACHPNLGDEAIWAEWPGELARAMAAIYGEDVPCLFLQGTAGDVDCITFSIPREQVGRGIAGAAMLAFEREESPIESPVLDWRVKVLAIPRLVKTPETDAMMEALRSNPNPTYLERTWPARYDAWPAEPRCLELPIQCLRIGNTAVVALPAEIFTRIGLEIKRYSPVPRTLVVTCANARAGYIPGVDQANRGGYGEWPFMSRHMVPEAGTMVGDTAIALLHELWPEGGDAP